jgi:hypothetical protein
MVAGGSADSSFSNPAVCQHDAPAFPSGRSSLPASSNPADTRPGGAGRSKRSPMNSVGAVLTPAGLENSQDILSVAITKDPTDPAWKDDAAYKEWVSFMDKYPRPLRNRHRPDDGNRPRRRYRQPDHRAHPRLGQMDRLGLAGLPDRRHGCAPADGGAAHLRAPL